MYLLIYFKPMCFKICGSFNQSITVNLFCYCCIKFCFTSLCFCNERLYFYVVFKVFFFFQQNFSQFSFTCFNKMKLFIVAILCCVQQVLSTDGKTEVGSIRKQWAGLLREAFTDSDHFGITFPLDLDVNIKAVLLGACMLIVSCFKSFLFLFILLMCDVCVLIDVWVFFSFKHSFILYLQLWPKDRNTFILFVIFLI